MESFKKISLVAKGGRHYEENKSQFVMCIYEKLQFLAAKYPNIVGLVYFI